MNEQLTNKMIQTKTNGKAASAVNAPCYSFKIAGDKGINLFNCDWRDLLPKYEDNHFDLAIVDPEYGLGMDNQKVRVKPDRPNTYKRAGKKQYIDKEWDNEPPGEDYFNELYRVSKNQIIFGANYFCEHLPSGYGWIFWNKQMGKNNFSAGEFAFQSIQKRSEMYSYPSMRVEGTRIHPTQKPVELYRSIIQDYANEGDKILDTHLGSGSIAIACCEEKFDLTACEIDQEYFEAMKKRVEEYRKQLQLF